MDVVKTIIWTEKIWANWRIANKVKYEFTVNWETYQVWAIDIPFSYEKVVLPVISRTLDKIWIQEDIFIK